MKKQAYSSITITNVYGVNNKGDQWLFRVLTQELAGAGVRCVNAIGSEHAAVQSNDLNVQWVQLPWASKVGEAGWRGATRRIGRALRLIPEALGLVSPSAFSEALRRTRLVIACPGGYLEDSSRSLFSHLLQLTLARLACEKVVMAPQSIGPIRGRIAGMWVRVLLARVDRIFVREDWSFDFCMQIGLTRQVARGPDLALVDPLWDPVAPQKMQDRKRRRRRIQDGVDLRVGMTVVNWQFDGSATKRDIYLNALRGFVRECEMRGWDVVLLPQTQGMGAQTDDQLGKWLCHGSQISVLPQPCTEQEYRENVRDLDVLVGVRLHSCLFALSEDVPMINISYLPKCTSILSELGLENWIVSASDVSGETLLELIRSEGFGDGAYWKRIDEKWREIRDCQTDAWREYIAASVKV